MAASPSGWALRKNGTCEVQEVDCGETVEPYRVCCPRASFCPHQYNVNCCPTSANCTQSLVPNPKCANSTWDLYDNDGYFCCLPGYQGYAVKSTNSNGCASPGYQLQPGEVLLRLIKAGVTSSSSTTTTTTAPPITLSGSLEPTATPSTSDGSSDGLSSGAKAGIGVGAGLGAVILLAVVFFFVWRRKRGQATQLPPPPAALQQQQDQVGPGVGSSTTAPGKYYVVGGEQELAAGEVPPKPREMDGQGRYVPELGDGHHYELEGDTSHPRVEVQG